MEQQERTLLAIASRLLAYPDDDFMDQQFVINESIDETITSEALKKDLKSAINPFFGHTLKELRIVYVATFDLKAKHGLYLTAHELGDSSKRGAALIKLQKIVNKAGFERIDGELADYIPMLFEFLAVAPDSQDNDRLVRRLAAAVHRVLSNLSTENLYYNVLSILMTNVFPKPTQEELDKLEFEREEADLEELPFPIMYS